MSMSLADFRVNELWKHFMTRRAEIKNSVTTNLVSMAIYKRDHFTHFKPTNEFEKWAAVEVSDFKGVPHGMDTFTVPAGLYAVFHYKGSSADSRIFQHIYGTWLPASVYRLDDRPHFEILGNKYRANDPTSEEDICIPIIGRS